MVVPNFVPDPIEVPGNVTQESYPARTAFVQRVAAMGAAAVGVLAFLGIYAPVEYGETAVWALAAWLLATNALRTMLRGSRAEAYLAAGLLPVTLMLGGLATAWATAQGIPLWSAGIGIVCAAAYAALAGRDFSFVGQYAVAGVVSSVGVAVVCLVVGIEGKPSALALGLNAGVLLYWVYDLAALLPRRRLGEELAAVHDLFRDPFNFIGYLVRCVRHWQRHRIWAIPPIPPLEIAPIMDLLKRDPPK